MGEKDQEIQCLRDENRALSAYIRELQAINEKLEISLREKSDSLASLEKGILCLIRGAGGI